MNEQEAQDMQEAAERRREQALAEVDICSDLGPMSLDSYERWYAQVFEPREDDWADEDDDCLGL